MALAPILVELKANAGEFMAKMDEAHHEVEKLGTHGAANMKKFEAVGKAAFLGFGGAAVAVGVMAVKAAMDGQVAHAQLAQAVKNSGGSMEEIEPKVEGLTGHFAKLGITRDQLEQGLTTMTTALHSPEKALENVGLAADLAAYKHISLSDASLVVAKAMEGQLKPMKALGIDLPVAAGGAAKLASATHKVHDAQERLRLATEKVNSTTGPAHVKALKAQEYASLNLRTAQEKMKATQGAAKTITEALSRAVGGQAAAAADTFSGKIKAVQASAENWLEQLGNRLIPIILKVIDAISWVVKWLEKHKVAAIELAVAIGGPLVIAMGAALVAFLIANAAIIGIIAACALLVVGVMYLSTHWHQVWTEIKKIASDVWQWLLAKFNSAGLLVAPLRIQIAMVRLSFEIAMAGAKLAVRVAYDVIRGIIDLFTGNFHDLGKRVGDIGGAFKTAWGAVSGAVEDAWNIVSPIIGQILGALQTVIDTAGRVISDLGKVASAPGKALGWVSKHFAQGGYVDRPTVALVGEGPEPEFIVPKSKMSAALSAAAAVGAAGGGGGGDMHVHVYIDGQQVHSSVQKADRKYRLRNGQSAFA